MSGPARRAHGIDLLRLLAAVQMISGHTVDALIAPEHRSGSLWATWTMIRGLTAVAFLFASGVSFAMVAAQSPERRAPRIRRALQLVAISYALHPPVALFSPDAALREHSLGEFFAVDVLACIGVTLLTLELLAARLSPRGFAIGSGALGLAALVAAPLTAAIEPAGLAAPLLDYVTRRGGSLFPVLPYAGFALLGGAVGSVARPREGGPRPAAVLGVVALGLAAISATWAALGDTPSHEAYYAWPAASFARAAAVTLGASLLTLATLGVDTLPKWMTTLAGQTLFLYVSHLLALYVGGIGLVHFFGASLSVGASSAVALALIVLCSVAALAWDRARERRALTARRSAPP